MLFNVSSEESCTNEVVETSHQDNHTGLVWSEYRDLDGRLIDRKVTSCNGNVIVDTHSGVYREPGVAWNNSTLNEVMERSENERRN